MARVPGDSEAQLENFGYAREASACGCHAAWHHRQGL